MTTFREAMDLLGLTAVEMAEKLGVSPATVRQARMDPENPGHRPPPQGWEKVVARLARDRLPEMTELAELDKNGE